MTDELSKLHEDIEDLENVVENDDSSDESTSENLYTISSFGVDQTAEVLVRKLGKKQYVIPDFQRDYVWSKIDASKFIESLLLGLPVPGIFLFKEGDTQKHLVIDGQQRLKSLQKYYDGLFNDRKFKLVGLKSKWDDKGYDELSEEDQARLDDAIIHVTIFKQDTPTDNMDSVYEVFERINSGGMRLSPQEIRSCVAHGNFNALLFELNDNSNWRFVFGNKSKRLKDIELILRFFAFKYDRANYARPMKKFLTDFMTSKKNLDPNEEIELKKIWNRTLDVLVEALGTRPFRPGGRALNVAFFDCFSVALAEAIENNSSLTSSEIKAAYDSLSSDSAFLTLISSSTADDESVRKRFEAAINSFT